MTALSALATLLTYYAYPPLTMFGMVATAGVHMWRRRANLLRVEREWARAEEWQWTRTEWPR